MIVSCLVAFVASVGSALANDYAGYMAARFMQGWGVGPAATVGLAMFQDIYSELERGEKVGYWTLAIDLGTHIYILPCFTMLNYPRSPFRTFDRGLCSSGFLHVPCLAHCHFLRCSLLGDVFLPPRDRFPARSNHVPRWLHAQTDPIPQRKADHWAQTPQALEHHRELCKTVYLSSHCHSDPLLLLDLVLGA